MKIKAKILERRKIKVQHFGDKIANETKEFDSSKSKSHSTITKRFN